MNIKIRQITLRDKDAVMDMMREFYASPAVSTNGSEEIFCSDIAACLNDSPYLEGYVFEERDNILGYAMVAKSFSTEFGRPCKWIEDLYLKESARGNSIGTRFLKYIEEKYPDSIFRLEVERENERAVNTYKKCGYTFLEYDEMIKI